MRIEYRTLRQTANPDMSSELRFRFEVGSPPAEPIQACGDYHSLGWDIPNVWARDANGDWWHDTSGHGSGMVCVKVEAIIDEMSSQLGVDCADSWRIEQGLATQTQIAKETEARDRQLFERLQKKYGW